MKYRMRIAMLSLANLLACSGVFAQGQAPKGTILEIAAPAYLKPAGKPEAKLDPRKDLLREVYEGDVLRAGPEGRIRLWVNGEMKIVAGLGQTLAISRPGGKLNDQQERVVEALRKYGMRGGNRGGGTGIYSPPDEGKVRIERFEVRWIPTGGKKTAKIKIETVDGDLVWSQAGVDVAAGGLDADLTRSAKAALTDHALKGGVMSFHLRFEPDGGTTVSVRFEVLTRQEAIVLEGKFANHERESDPLLRAILRAIELTEWGLFTEAAEAYEAALKLAPDSGSLLESTMEAQKRTGNFVRARELRKKLLRDGSRAS